MIKNKSGNIKGFHNVCRHRGCKLVDKSKNSKVISCPYHKWSYKLDGDLIGTPLYTPSKREFDKSKFSLFPINIEINKRKLNKYLI